MRASRLITLIMSTVAHVIISVGRNKEATPSLSLGSKNVLQCMFRPSVSAHGTIVTDILEQIIVRYIMTP